MLTGETFIYDVPDSNESRFMDVRSPTSLGQCHDKLADDRHARARWLAGSGDCIQIVAVRLESDVGVIATDARVDDAFATNARPRCCSRELPDVTDVNDPFTNERWRPPPPE